jgi:hypothetical protein
MRGSGEDATPLARSLVNPDWRLLADPHPGCRICPEALEAGQAVAMPPAMTIGNGDELTIMQVSLRTGLSEGVAALGAKSGAELGNGRTGNPAPGRGAPAGPAFGGDQAGLLGSDRYVLTQY